MLLKISSSLLLIFCIQTAIAQNLNFDEGIKWKQKGNFVEALKHFEKAYSENPTDRQIHTEYANCAFKARQFTKALPALEELIELEPNNVQGLIKLAKIYSYSSRKDKSVVFAERATKLNPTNADDLITLGDAYFFVKHYPKAVKMYKKISPANKYTLNKIAKSYSRMGNYNAAAQSFEQLIKIQENPKPELYYQYGNALFDAGRFKHATLAYISAKDKGFYSPKLINESIAVGFLSLKAYQPALEYYQEALKSAPYDKALNLEIAKCYNALRQFSKAREVITALLKDNPNDGDLTYSYGMTYFREGKITKAESYFNKAFQLKPSLKSLRYVKSDF